MFFVILLENELEETGMIIEVPTNHVEPNTRDT